MENNKNNENQQQEIFRLISEINQLKDEVTNLKNIMYGQQLELEEIGKYSDLSRLVIYKLKKKFNIYLIISHCFIKIYYFQKLFPYGSQGHLVSLNDVHECMVLGFDCNGFINLAERVFGKNFFVGKTWAKFDREMKTSIDELLCE